MSKDKFKKAKKMLNDMKQRYFIPQSGEEKLHNLLIEYFGNKDQISPTLSIKFWYEEIEPNLKSYKQKTSV